MLLSRASMMMTSLETLKTSFALDIKLFEESVTRDIGTEGGMAKFAALEAVDERLWGDIFNTVSFRQQCMIFWNNHALLPKAYVHSDD